MRLGKVTQETALAVKLKVERLVAAQITAHALDNETAAWVASLDQVLAEKLARVGLIGRREVAVLGPFVANYLSGRTDVKPRTMDRLRRSFQHLLDFFGPDRALRDVTAGDCEELARKLRRTLGENTVRRRLSYCKQLFRFAERKRLVTENPFSEMRGLTVAENRARDFFVTASDAQRVLDACPCHELRLIFALCRWGGLRCPSEVLELRWCDIDWARNRLRVRSPKTAHAGKDSRELPLFPELRPHLELAFERAEDGAEYVIGKTRSVETNLRTQFTRIIRRAGLEPWPKLLQNLRSSRATELAREFPAHVAADWLGHSALVARKFYWRTTDADFDRAATILAAPESAAQNAAQQLGELGCMEANAQSRKRKNPEKLAFAGAGEMSEYARQDSNL